jgi:hypothetical protein
MTSEALAAYCGMCIYWQALDTLRTAGECRRRLERPMSESRPDLRRWAVTDATDGCVEGVAERRPDWAEHCGKCIAFQAGNIQTEQGHLIGECRRFAPARRPASGSRAAGARWPSTTEALWCGDGIAAEAPPASAT